MFCCVSIVKNKKHKLLMFAIASGSCILIVSMGIAVIAKTCDQSPDLAFAHTINGIVRAEIFDDRQVAIDSYSQAIQLQPKRAVTYYFQARNRYKLGNK
jgi:hypothetical protein